jgi:hypothetical protein
VTQEQIAAELRTLAQHQKVLLELEQMLRRMRTERGWTGTKLATEVIELQKRLKEVERRVEMLLMKAAADDDL